MALTVSSQTLYDGARNALLMFTATGGANDGETNAVKVNVASLNPSPAQVKVWEIEYDVQGIMVQIYWDATVPVLLSTAHGWGKFDFHRIGGAPNPKAPGFTGNILFSTVKPIGGGDYMEALVQNQMLSDVNRGAIFSDELDQLRTDSGAVWSYSIKLRLKKLGVPFNTGAI